ncbi:RnaseH-domain-containing protein [Trametes sanguinea]|nr:RnaseH-domain-containing protein [Trametes sanguinea]
MAAAVVAPFAPLHIVTDSRYVVDGLTNHLQRWEDSGWTDVANAEHVRDVVARLRAHSAPTTVRWVKGHSGIPGNDAADELAKRGATKEVDDEPPLPPCRTEYLTKGLRLTSVTQKLAYKAICKWKAKVTVRAGTEATVRMVVDGLKREWKLWLRPASLWKAVKGHDVRREMRDFWWKALHSALKVGKYWEKIPGYEDRAMCPQCQVTESLEHLLLECAAPGQEVVWTLVRRFLAKRGLALPGLNLATVLAAPCLTLKRVQQNATAGEDRLVRIAVMEAAHLIWKMRCTRVIEPDTGLLHPMAIVNRWHAAMNSRLALDQNLTNAYHGRRVLTRQQVLDTWRGVLEDERGLPGDWIHCEGVLVGRTSVDGDVLGVG